MSIALLHSRATLGIRAVPVRVEIHLGPGLPGFTVVGLADTAVRESKDRVRSALINGGFRIPQQRITVNLAPADLPKDGGRFDLPIAVGILLASGQLGRVDLKDMEWIGELALSGALSPVPAVLPGALAAARDGHTLVVPAANGDEAALAGADTLAVNSLTELCAHLKGDTRLPLHAPPASPGDDTGGAPCLSQIRGQPAAKRVLEIAAAGGHSLLMSGPPGAGKSMLASRLPGLLPPLDRERALEVAAIHSLRHARPAGAFLQPPYRAPHHTASAAALVGGGGRPRPGEISLAHEGVLFLDEMPEFQPRVLEVLREPLETGEVHIARAAQQVTFPARFQLVAAMNPCPCGYLGDPEKSCGYECEKAKRYQRRLSGPLLDRIDLHLEVPAVSPDTLLGAADGEPSRRVRERVLAARACQLHRQGRLNRELDAERLMEALGPHKAWLTGVMERLELSARALHRSLRVARTIADLAGSEVIRREHLREALSYRQNLLKP
ncbi:MAG: YifB family Mg chelatase-like AAA ATPase [Alcanivorax sp.]|jgi:magnesium chelatase family protein|uniref:YifB family Mg chelatase-like AAA ATPase n=1 Tax=Alloalcanivorax venustensis TaxID=172371 RepID=UPI000ED40F5C|nr:magnesium chelatase family protein [Alcanivorax sp. DSM 26295]HCO65491.1 ATP-dependent protease [Alcanivorax sp.]